MPTVRSQKRKTLDITSWFSRFISRTPDNKLALREDASDIYMDLSEHLEQFAMFLGGPSESEDILIDPKFESFRRLLVMIFAGKLRRLVQDNMRTYKQMLGGELSYSETVMYRLVKKDMSGNVIQNVYIPNSSDIDVFRYVDTQVKYNKDYEYTIFAYQAVIGTKYRYSDLLVGWRDRREMKVSKKRANSMAKFNVTYEPSIQLVEVPYYSRELLVIDDPPLLPDVDIIPYKGVSDRIQIRLNGNTGVYEARPVIIEQKDNLPIDRIKKSYRLEENDPIRFSSDDAVTRFEIYRMERKPSSYSEMRGHLHMVAETDASSRTPQRANSSAQIDSIEPNKKYYYMFRTIDRHELISNPSAIYEVELVEENASVFSLISVVDFAEPARAPSRTMKRYLHIKPSTAHSLIDRDKMDIGIRDGGKDIERIHLGVAEEKIWGKKIKVRLVSKSSGKKFDLNLNFKTKHIKPGNR
jgi:hypothetical protein